jgi:hypothetical protein
MDLENSRTNHKQFHSIIFPDDFSAYNNGNVTGAFTKGSGFVCSGRGGIYTPKQVAKSPATPSFFLFL